MRILACLKQVREPESVFDLADGWLAWRGPDMRRMSSLDEFALEEALRLKDAGLARELWAVTVGPAEAEPILRRALAMGADRAARLAAPEEPAPRPLAVAEAIAHWAGGIGFDLILAGVMSEDAMQGMVGPMLAEIMGLSCATSVVSIAPEEGGGRVLVTREMEGGRRQRLAAPLPAVLTIQSGVNRPRYPTLSKALAAKRAEIPTLTAHAPGPARETRGAWGWPERTRAGVFLEGDTRRKAEALRDILRERALL